MTQAQKFTEEEIGKINELRKELSNLNSQYGHLSFTRFVIEKELKSIEEKFDSLINREDKLLDELQKKYGVGNLNLDTGEFISAS